MNYHARAASSLDHSRTDGHCTMEKATAEECFTDAYSVTHTNHETNASWSSVDREARVAGNQDLPFMVAAACSLQLAAKARNRQIGLTT